MVDNTQIWAKRGNKLGGNKKGYTFQKVLLYYNMINKKHISLSILLWGVLLLIMSCVAIYYIIQFGIQSFDEYSYLLKDSSDIDMRLIDPDFAPVFFFFGLFFISIPLFSIFKYWITADKKINIVMPYYIGSMIVVSTSFLAATYDTSFETLAGILAIIFFTITFSFMYYVSNSKNYKKRFGKKYEYKS